MKCFSLRVARSFGLGGKYVEVRLAQLVTRHPRIQELDINPFLAASDPDQGKALDVRIRVE